MTTYVPPARHLLRAKDLIDSRYFDPLDVAALFSTEDCRASYEELKSRGVEFAQEPTEQPYGMDLAVRDPSGNQLRVIQAQPVA